MRGCVEGGLDWGSVGSEKMPKGAALGVGLRVGVGRWVRGRPVVALWPVGVGWGGVEWCGMGEGSRRMGWREAGEAR